MDGHLHHTYDCCGVLELAPRRASQDKANWMHGNINAMQYGILKMEAMHGHLILDVHLIKLVDAADAVVCQHQGTRLYAELVAVLLLHEWQG